MTAYWDVDSETMPVEARSGCQLEGLRKTLTWVYEKVPYYRKVFDRASIKPEDCRSLTDLAIFPFTDKNSLRENYPFGLCAVPLEDLACVHASSGTTGKPVTGPYTAEDLRNWAVCMARNLWAGGVRKKDICQNAYGYGLFTGGLGFHLGALEVGCTIVPTSAGRTERQVELMQDFGTTALFCTPTYALTIAEMAGTLGLDIGDWPLRVGIFGAEPWSDAIRREIESRLGIEAHEAYGLTEMGGPGVAFSCSEKTLHINEDHYFPEIIDPDSGASLPLGQEGELVFTSLKRRAMPLVRFRTRDISSLSRKECPCGRTLISMKKIIGRYDDMLVISGVNVFPSQIEAVIMEFPEMEAHYLLRIKAKGHLSALEVEVEARREFYSGGRGALEAMSKKVGNRIHQVVGIRVPVSIVPPNTIVRSEGKAQRVVDER